MPTPLFVLLPVPHAWQSLFALLVLTPERLVLLAGRLERHRQWQRQDAALSLSCFSDTPPLVEVFVPFPALSGTRTKRWPSGMPPAWNSRLPDFSAVSKAAFRFFFVSALTAGGF